MTNFLLRKLKIISLRNFNENESQLTAFGIFGMINFVITYILWQYKGFGSYENIIIPSIASLLCFLLLFHEDYPIKLRSQLHIYWHVALLYCLPFLSTYMLLNNHNSDAWLINSVLSIFILSFLVDWSFYIIILSCGVILGWLCHFMTSGSYMPSDITPETFPLILYLYCASIAIGFLFSRNKKLAEQDKLLSVKAITATIAHEMRTPLLSIYASASSIKEHLPTLIDTYDLRIKEYSQQKIIEPMILKSLNEMPANLENTVRNAFTIIDMFLTKLKDNSFEEKLQNYSIASCVQKALEQYKLTINEKELITLDLSNDFIFSGNELLFTHLIFNLLKNSMFYIKHTNKGEIIIWLESNEHANYLHFKDTACGIAANSLPFIFDRFYTKNKHGTGLGLSFCKLVMKEFGGDIECHSTLHAFTEFILKFPKIS